MVTPLGVGVEKTWDSLLAGRSGIRPITRFDASQFSVRFAGQIVDFSPEASVDPRALKRMDPFTQFALVASNEALQDAAIDLEHEDRTRFACIMGTGIGGIIELETQTEVLLIKGVNRVSPLTVPKMMFNAFTAYVALHHRLLGPNYATGSACASSNHAIGVALRTIQYGDADVALTGGSEAAVCPVGIAAFAQMKALSTRNDDPQRASRPFDKNRDGFVMGEGAAVIILEERERALRRGARIYAELVGFGSSDDAFHLTAPDEAGEGPVRAMQLALGDAGLRPEQIGYVNAHGTSTPLNDKIETLAIKRVLGDHARRIPINSTKSMIGHLLGASGAVEFAVTCLSLQRGHVHPTINQFTRDPECDLDYVANEAREARIDAAISNSFGFGGTNACLAVVRPR
jgi:3-oxoacyl-[acyl-carrier-protein] synthase II